MLMKTILSIGLVFALMAISGCEKPDYSKATEESGPVTRANGVASVTITGNDQMKYDLNAFTVHPGEKVKLTFENVGTMPVATMGHDLVILKQGEDYKAFAADVLKEKGDSPSGTVPAALADKVIAETHILGPGEKQTIEFTAPAAGEYPYLCTFPGHFVFMNGIMTVK